MAESNMTKATGSTIDSYDRYSVERVGEAEGVFSVLGEARTDVQSKERRIDRELSLVIELEGPENHIKLTRIRWTRGRIACITAMVILLVVMFVAVPIFGIVGTIVQHTVGKETYTYGEGVSDELETAPVTAPVPSKYDLSIVCSLINVQLPEGYNECKDSCSHGTCCFAVDSEKNCCDDYPLICVSYAGCTILDTVKNPSYGSLVKVPVPPRDVNDICSHQAKSTHDGLLLCRDVCLTGSCCWADGPENCFEYNAHVCAEYSPCSGGVVVVSGQRADVSSASISIGRTAVP